MTEDRTELQDLPTTQDALISLMNERRNYWQARIVQGDPAQSTRRRLVNLTSDLLDVLDRLEVQAISTPESRAYYRSGGDNHYAENVPLQGALETTFARAWETQERGEPLMAVPGSSRPPRAYTREETLLQVAQYLVIMVRYWDELPNHDPLGNMLFSVLTLLDGGPGSLPPFSVRAPGGEDLAGTLHERYSDLRTPLLDSTHSSLELAVSDYNGAHMQIDIHNPDDFTLENIRLLIASKDDSENRQIRVSNMGMIYLSDVTGYQQLDDVAFRLESLAYGTDHVGEKAALDDSWVTRIYNALNEWRTDPYTTYSDSF